MAVLRNRQPATKSLNFRYFIYSAEEEERKKKLFGNNASFGTVVVRGVPKRYTSMVSDIKESSSDGIVVAKGDIRKINYTPPTR